ncbi:NADH-Ubiquinone/plastoquinone (complex I), various chains family protein [Anoxybacillus sp. B7M1]|uniref:NADH dehydrogenase subunit 5 n=1 Tax=unclassified Anoxybacillus TaxID=2639704 RepID=UPI000698475D|nr:MULTISPECIES: NADH dehydrogenase subunit 5 [unclassified Anoxybacillus]ANB55875.1 NADH-Ubiquinone/plastoquinone (complex I), various chains family protein [Anoxybacillus sp. B2M1]ANB64183.1 NADH-Ubiquinone/plastoquinone (complex I), various chains family protein [Anoxybacillus sp. B7M1]
MLFIWSWFISVGIVFVSGALCLYSRIPERYVYIHTRLLLLPAAAALIGWIGAGSGTEVGAWRFDGISWLMAFYISLLSWIIQTFSLRYLHGDRAYRHYFWLLTWTAGAASVIWSSNDLRVMAICWGLPFVGLAALTWLKREWAPSRAAAMQMGIMFLASWLAVAVLAVWIWTVTGKWSMSAALLADQLAEISFWGRIAMNGLLLLAALIPAGQWPFHRWLLESAVTPTPVSAVMHAGLVNAGGLLLARFSPLFNMPAAHEALFIIAFLSILLGTGISFVHVDYKRQLVASTMAQMGVMFVQCALGAYGAAVVHLILHGLFKATLFLQSGSVVPRPERIVRVKGGGSWWGGALIGLAVGMAFWIASPSEPTRLFSALLLGASMMIAWGRLADFREGRWLGLVTVVMLALASEEVRHFLTEFVQAALPSGSAPPSALEWLAFVLFASAAIVAFWIVRHRSSLLFVRFYMWLVHFGEPRLSTVEPHPHYLSIYVKEGARDE